MIYLQYVEWFYTENSKSLFCCFHREGHVLICLSFTFMINKKKTNR